MMNTQSTCQHANADAMETAACGQPESWVCADCGADFTITHKHRLLRSTKHAFYCKGTKAERLFGGCGCSITRVQVCMDCLSEFPLDVVRDDVEFYS